MNPTDQARKEARKRELKKNKKQRMAVRQAVIKTKDPKQMLAELDLLDEMELNPASNVPYNDKVVKEKRLKLLENIQRITQYYLREDPDQGTELKRQLDDYRTDRLKKEVYYESVRNAQKVKIDSIPLPEAPFTTPQLSDIPLPGVQPQGILKKNPYMISAPTTVVKKEPPGPPPGPPPIKKKFKGNDPTLHPRPPSGPPPSEVSGHADGGEAYDPEQGIVLDDDNSEDENDEEFQHRDEDESLGRKGKFYPRNRDSDDEDEMEDAKRIRIDEAGVTPLQAMMLKLAGQSVPTRSRDEDDSRASSKRIGFSDAQQKPPPGPPPGLPPGPLGMSRMVPPGPPPGVPPTLPRGPPPGLPPGMQMRMGGPASMNRQPPANTTQDAFNRKTDKNLTNVLSAPPSLVQNRQEKEKSRPGMIVAKPQIISNPRADVTRFMPTSLRVKRENAAKIGPQRPQDSAMPATSNRYRQDKNKKQSKVNADIAYDSFMKEMKGLL